MMFNKLIQMTSALFSSSVTYAIPVVAVLWGVWDGEQILWNHLVGLLVIITGIYLINKKYNPPQQRREGLFCRSKDCSI
jgi:drug/metabolite transporter (DMT)-like permease